MKSETPNYVPGKLILYCPFQKPISDVTEEDEMLLEEKQRENKGQKNYYKYKSVCVPISNKYCRNKSSLLHEEGRLLVN